MYIYIKHYYLYRLLLIINVYKVLIYTFKVYMYLLHVKTVISSIDIYLYIYVTFLCKSGRPTIYEFTFFSSDFAF